MLPLTNSSNNTETVSVLRLRLDLLRDKRRTALAQLAAEEVALAQALAETSAVREAVDVAQRLAQTVQQQAHNRIARVVTRCLEAVFDDAYEFKMEFDRKRGKTEGRLVFIRDGNEVDPLTAAGGGVVDVAAFACRLAFIMLAKPRPRRVMVLDEPFKFVWAGYIPRVRMMLEGLADELGMQFIIVTHIDALRTGTVYEVG